MTTAENVETLGTPFFVARFINPAQTSPAQSILYAFENLSQQNDESV